MLPIWIWFVLVGGRPGVPGPGGDRMGPAGPPGPIRRSACCLSGRHTGQSCLLQCFQCAMIWREEEQCGTVQDLPAWQVVMWFSTFFMVLQ